MPPVADEKSGGQNGHVCDPKVAEEKRQLRWDLLALADSFGWTDKPAPYIPPARDNKGVSPTGSSTVIVVSQKELVELLGGKEDLARRLVAQLASDFL